MDELIAALRGLIQRGVLHRVDDSGAHQVADVETAEGAVRSAAEVLQPPGLAVNPGTAGVMALVLAPGGDQGIPAVLLFATSAGLGNLAPGEAALHALDALARVHCEPGGIVRVRAAEKVIVQDCAEVEVTATTKISLTAPVTEIHGTANVIGVLKVNGTTMAVP